MRHSPYNGQDIYDGATLKIFTWDTTSQRAIYYIFFSFIFINFTVIVQAKDLMLDRQAPVLSTLPVTISGNTINAHVPSPENAFITSEHGTFVDFCSVTGCLAGPKLLAQTFFSATTRLPAIAQEVGVAFNFTNHTGFAPQWSPSTLYYSRLPSSPIRVTDVLSDDSIYRNTVDGCRSKLKGGGPTGRGSGIKDGSCRWDWLSEGLNGAKSAVSFATVVEPGGGAAWGRVENFVVRRAVGPIVAYANEEDCNNENADSSAGASFFMLCHFQGGGSSLTFPVFAYNYIGSGAVNSGSLHPFGAYNGYFISGQPGDIGSVVKDAGFADASNSDRVVHALAGRRHSIGFLIDESDSDAVLKVSGRHRAGLDFSAGTFQQAIVIPPLSLMCLNGNKSSCFEHDPHFGGVAFFPSEPGQTPGFSANANGDFKIAGRFRAPLRAPSSSSEPCEPGEFSDDANFHFVCVAPNQWKRTALSSW